MNTVEQSIVDTVEAAGKEGCGLQSFFKGATNQRNALKVINAAGRLVRQGVIAFTVTKVDGKRVRLYVPVKKGDD